MMANAQTTLLVVPSKCAGTVTRGLRLLPRVMGTSWFSSASASSSALSRPRSWSRSFTTDGVGTPPKRDSNPLELMKRSAEQQRLCDANGVRLPRVQWAFQLAVAQPHARPPSLKTVNIQRLVCGSGGGNGDGGPCGLDFVLKRPDGSGAPTTANLLAQQQHPNRPSVSVLYTSGHFTAGDTQEQWRGEGHVVDLSCKDGGRFLRRLVSVIPTYSLVGILASRRAQEALHKVEDILVSSAGAGAGGTAGHGTDSSNSNSMETEVHRTRIEKHARFIQLVQQTRNDLENGNVSPDELEDSLVAFRFVPDRLERMVGGPDHLVMDRWEWVNLSNNKNNNNSNNNDNDTFAATGEAPLQWSEPRHLLPF